MKDFSSTPLSTSTLYFGGTFDPPHLGHEAMVKMAQAKGFNDILVVPAGDPIHKQHKNITDFHHRFQMCQMAFGHLKNVTITDVENSLEKPTPTIHTLRAVIKDFDTRTEPVPFLLGADALESLPTWIEADILAKQLLFVVAGRKGYTIPETIDVQGETYPLNILLLDTPPDEASSKIQPLFKNPTSPTILSEKVNANVQAYIEEHELYRQPVNL